MNTYQYTFLNALAITFIIVWYLLGKNYFSKKLMYNSTYLAFFEFLLNIVAYTSFLFLFVSLIMLFVNVLIMPFWNFLGSLG